MRWIPWTEIRGETAKVVSVFFILKGFGRTLAIYRRESVQGVKHEL